MIPPIIVVPPNPALLVVAAEQPRCECVICCDGEHAGCCVDCAGCGDFDGAHCERCDGTGTCQVCGGDCAEHRA